MAWSMLYILSHRLCSDTVIENHTDLQIWKPSRASISVHLFHPPSGFSVNTSSEANDTVGYDDVLSKLSHTSNFEVWHIESLFSYGSIPNLQYTPVKLSDLDEVLIRKLC